MNHYILIDHVQVQDANAIAGLTWGFPAITHFLGFVHLLQRKMKAHSQFSDVKLGGCAVISHDQRTSTYQNGSSVAFTQSRNPPYLDSHDKKSTPPIIEEGKMSMTVSLLIEVKDSIPQFSQLLEAWIHKQCYLQRLAGGSIQNVRAVTSLSIKSDDTVSIRALQRRSLPGFVLINRSELLSQHLEQLQKTDSSIEMFDAWIDFIGLKRRARPAYELIDQHLARLAKDKSDFAINLLNKWQQHLKVPYDSDEIPNDLLTYFTNINDVADKHHKALINQWQHYIRPNLKTSAQWEYQPKPNKGYLVPIMCGYKAISDVIDNEEVLGTRDNETDVCFVEAVHSVGEWRSVHRIKTLDELDDAMWQYHYAQNWYLCSQKHSFDVLDDNIDDRDDDIIMQDPTEF